MEYQLVGDNAQALNLALRKGEALHIRKGSLIYSTPTIDFFTSTLDDFVKLIPKEVTHLAIGLTFLGRITPAILNAGSHLYINEKNLLAFTDKIRVSKPYRIHEKVPLVILSSTADNQMAFLAYKGDFVGVELNENQTLIIDPDNFVAADPTVSIVPVSEGLKDVLAGEEITLIEARGPGKVWMQTVTH